MASARFPWLTPAAWFWGAHLEDGAVKYRVVDGGYFDNSGATTAVDLIQHLESIAQIYELPLQIPSNRHDVEGNTRISILSPGRDSCTRKIVLNTRRARILTTLDLADRELGTITGPSGDGEVAASRIRRLQKVEIDDFVTRLPLGWQLSLASNFQIDRRTRPVRHCVPNIRFEQASKILAFSSADCMKLLIYHQLQGDNLDNALEAAIWMMH